MRTVTRTVRRVSYRKIKKNPEAGILPAELLPLGYWLQVLQNQLIHGNRKFRESGNPDSTTGIVHLCFLKLAATRVDFGRKVDSKITPHRGGDPAPITSSRTETPSRSTTWCSISVVEPVGLKFHCWRTISASDRGRFRGPTKDSRVRSRPVSWKRSRMRCADIGWPKIMRICCSPP